MILRKLDLEALLKALHATPHDVLGMHPVKVKGRKGVVCRAFLTDAVECEVVDLESGGEVRYPMVLLDEAGVFEVFIPGREEVFGYRLRVVRRNGEVRQFWDPYCFLPTLSQEDLYLFGQGNHHRIYRKMGAHIRHYEGVSGVAFSIWAPGARRVSVVGEFNNWDGRCHPMRSLGSSGVWELFVPGLEPGVKYKYELVGADGYLRLKTDPYGSYFESPPYNSSIVWNTDEGYEWGDACWMEQRATTDHRQSPMSVYELHLGSWRRVIEDGNRPLSYREAADELVEYVRQMGFTHVEFMPLAEHPFLGSWGYQVTGFFAPTHRYGTPDDFKYLVDRLHQGGIGVILDWVPAHFPRDTFALAELDGTHLYEHADPRQGQHQDWGTLIFNYERHEVRNFLVANALSWLDRYHIDGLRVDAVASMLYLDYSREDGQWVPNRYGGRENLGALEFLRQVNDCVHEYYPGALMIAEESTDFGGVTRPTSEGGLGFDYKWNMGWMHDTLKYFNHDPIHRKWHHNQLTFGMLYQYSEHFIQVFSHDEVVHGKASMLYKMGTGSDTRSKARDLRSLYAFMWAWPGKKCLFMGCEFGQSHEWKYDSSLDWHLLQYADHEGIQRLLHDLNQLYRGYPALGRMDYDPEGFAWINGGDWEQSVLTFLRKGKSPEETFMVACNFTPVERSAYRIGLPHAGYWREVANTDSAYYGGDNRGNHGGLHSEALSYNGQPYSATFLLPGNSTLIFKCEPKD